ncbi:hypothetical protein FCJ61_37905 [Burkholderia metallica]|nr:hypothetical protein [Burkholderia metallica]
MGWIWRFSASLLLCFSASLLLCFSASLLLCFSASPSLRFSASPLRHVATFSVSMPCLQRPRFLVRIKAQDLERAGTRTPLDWVRQLSS